MNKIIKIILSILICQSAGLIGSIFTSSSINSWYVQLQKPSFNPPNWLFAPVWTLLFLLMGVSLYLVWQSEKSKKTALIFFSIQLVLNIGWSAFFFGLQSPFLAFVEIIILWLFILLSLILFYRISKLAGLLFLPYLLWVGFAAILNYSIWQLL